MSSFVTEVRLPRLFLTFSIAALALLAGCAPEQRLVQVPRVPLQEPPDVEPGTVVMTQGPSVTFDRFLPEATDPARRQTFWSLFKLVEPEAKTFAAAPNLWIPLQAIDYIPGPPPGMWSQSGTIRIAPEVDPGTMFHEVFHTVFHRSELHKGGDRSWAEAWCDGFRFAAEHEFLNPPSPWADRIQRFSAMTFEQVSLEHKKDVWLEKYGYPASLVVKRSGGTMDGLRKLWFRMIEQRQRAGRDVLDEFFGYAIQEGRPLDGGRS